MVLLAPVATQAWTGLVRPADNKFVIAYYISYVAAYVCF